MSFVADLVIVVSGVGLVIYAFWMVKQTLAN
jgi:hypothetical protein